MLSRMRIPGGAMKYLGNPNLEVFKFGMYVLFPVAIMYCAYFLLQKAIPPNASLGATINATPCCAMEIHPTCPHLPPQASKLTEH
jgi:hypothetical protein